MNGSEPADLPIGTIAFTLSPNPQKYKSTDPSLQYKSLLSCLFAKKAQMNATFHEYYFVPELNSGGNVHIHGKYIVKDKIKYFRWFLPACKQWGFIIVKNKRINSKWDEYLNKELEDTIDILGDDVPIPLTKETLADYDREIRPNLTMSKTIPKKIKKYNIEKYFLQ